MSDHPTHHDVHCEAEYVIDLRARTPCRCVERRLCTCPFPESGGVPGVNRGHLLGCPGLVYAATAEEDR